MYEDYKIKPELRLKAFPKDKPAIAIYWVDMNGIEGGSSIVYETPEDLQNTIDILQQYKNDWE